MAVPMQPDHEAIMALFAEVGLDPGQGPPVAERRALWPLQRPQLRARKRRGARTHRQPAMGTPIPRSTGAGAMKINLTVTRGVITEALDLEGR